jgi:uncharacterized protein YegJ (DUF2314 family)
VAALLAEFIDGWQPGARRRNRQAWLSKIFGTGFSEFSRLFATFLPPQEELPVIRNIFLAVVIAVAAWSYLTGTGKRSVASANPVEQKARKDQIFMIKAGDPSMNAARQKARVTLPEFLKVAQSPRCSQRNFAVKVGIEENSQTEYFWIAPFKLNGDMIIGNINNTPRLVKNVQNKQQITFHINDVSDWMYVENGKMKGNYSACVLLKNEPKEQADAFKKKFGLECES